MRRYPETLGGFGGNGAGGNTPQMPHVWRSPSVQELERCLTMLEQRFPRVHSHIWARYIDTQRVILTVRLQAGRYIGLPARSEVIIGAYAVDRDPKWRRVLPQQRTPGDPTERVLVAFWPRWVDTRATPPHGHDKVNGAVELGVRYLDRAYRGEPMLPHEFACHDPDCDRCKQAA